MKRSFVSAARTAVHAAVALLPGAIKVPIYRHLFGFEIARGAKIGISLLDVAHLTMERGAVIGHGNVLIGTELVELKEGAQIGFGNLLRGGREVRLGRFSTVLRFNVLNSIPDPDLVVPADPRLLLDTGAHVVSGHRLDFTDRISLGKNVIVAGRSSSLWTHNRQLTKPIAVGDFCYLGSEVRLAPGATLGTMSILAMGAVLTGHAESHQVYGGVPAKPIRQITVQDQEILRRKSRKDLPDGIFD